MRDSKLRTPLLVACAGGKADVVRLLIRWGADVNNPMGDIIGNKPLDLAVISSNVDTVLAVLEAGKLYEARLHKKHAQRERDIRLTIRGNFHRCQSDATRVIFFKR